MERYIMCVWQCLVCVLFKLWNKDKNGKVLPNTFTCKVMCDVVLCNVMWCNVV